MEANTNATLESLQKYLTYSRLQSTSKSDSSLLRVTPDQVYISEFLGSNLKVVERRRGREKVRLPGVEKNRKSTFEWPSNLEYDSSIAFQF